MVGASEEVGRDDGALVGAVDDAGGLPEFEFETGSDDGGVIADASFFFVLLFVCIAVGTLLSLDLLSRECVAAGVKGGDCMRDAAGVIRGELLPETVLS